MEVNILSPCMQCFLLKEGGSHVIFHHFAQRSKTKSVIFFFFLLSTQFTNNNKTPYLDVKQLKVKPNRVRVLDFDIRHHIDSKRRVALVERKYRVANSAHVIDHRDLKDCKDHNHQDNNNQQDDQTDTAGYSAAGRPNTAKTGEIFRSFSGGFDGCY